MKTTVYFSEFCDYFRQIRPDNFSYQGLRVLFDYLEDIFVVLTNTNLPFF